MLRELEKISHRAGGQNKQQRNNTINQENHKHTPALALWRRSPRHSKVSSELGPGKNTMQLNNERIQ